ncbi:hypothetical protein PFZ49_09700 [Microbacterium lacticum]|uniref:hypothetical protein n=1 Tax=Microbacterium lacticum TaxID=33885 RepID=UPI003A87D8AE
MVEVSGELTSFQVWQLVRRVDAIRGDTDCWREPVECADEGGSAEDERVLLVEGTATRSKNSSRLDAARAARADRAAASA